MGLQIEAKLAVLGSQGPPPKPAKSNLSPKVPPKRLQSRSQETPELNFGGLGLDFEASRLDFRASRARFPSHFGSTGRKKEDMYFLSDASTFGCWLFDLQFSVFVFCCLPCSNVLRE